MNLSPSRKKVVLTPKCSMWALPKFPRTVGTVASCIASAWCEPFQRPASASWQPEQTALPTNSSGSSAYASELTQAAASVTETAVATHRRKIPKPATRLRNVAALILAGLRPAAVRRTKVGFVQRAQRTRDPLGRASPAIHALPAAARDLFYYFAGATHPPILVAYRKPLAGSLRSRPPGSFSWGLVGNSLREQDRR